MKNKYIILSLLFSGFQIGARDIFKTEIKGDKIVKGEKITVDMVGKEVFDNLVKFDRGVKALRNADTIEKVNAAFESLKELPKNLFVQYRQGKPLEAIHPFEIAKKINLKLTNLFIALADLKKMPDVKVGLQKTISSALIVQKVVEGIKWMNDTFNYDSPSSFYMSLGNKIASLSSVFSCRALGSFQSIKDNRNNSALSVAVSSGNFWLVYLLSKLAKGCSSIDFKDLENKFNNSIKPEDFKNPDAIKNIKNQLDGSAKFKKEFDKAVDNFVKNTKSFFSFKR